MPVTSCAYATGLNLQLKQDQQDPFRKTPFTNPTADSDFCPADLHAATSINFFSILLVTGSSGNLVVPGYQQYPRMARVIP
jgi:hypothetical protein